MARVLALVRGARQHGSGAVVLVSGPAGIGKTALLSEIRGQADRTGVRVASSKCDEGEQVWPAAPLIAALRAGRDPLLTAAEYEQITRLAGEPLLLVERIAAVLESAATATPLLIAVDDVQWADRVSRFLVRTLSSRLVGLPVVWVLAGRGTDLGLGPVDAEHVHLTPLSSSDVTAIAADRLGRAPDDRTRRFLDAAGGNPFLANQIVDNVARAAALGEPDSVPAEFTAVIARRLTELAGPPRELIQLVAVAGRPLPLRDVAALDGAGQVAEAIESELVGTAGDALVFRHDLVREAVYSTIANPRELHRRFADHYLTTVGDPLLAAPHARAAAVPGDLASAAILVAAAEKIASVNAEDAGELATLAFRTVRPEQPEWLPHSRRCLAVLCQTQRAADAIAVANLILARIDDGNLAGEVETEAARALWLAGRVGELVERTQRVLAHAELAPKVIARLGAAQALANTRLSPGDIAASAATAALQQARAVDDREALTLALQAAGEAARNEAHHQESLLYYRELRSTVGTAHLAEEIIALQFLDRYDHAEALLAEVRSDSHTTLVPALHCAQLWLDFHLGRLDDAEASSKTLFELGQQLGDNVYALDALIVRVAVALLRGDLETATAHLRLAHDLADADDDVRRPGLAVVHGWLAAGRGDITAAVETLRPVLAGAGEGCRYWALWPCWMGVFFEVGTVAADSTFALGTVHAAELAASRNPGVASFEGVALNLRGRYSRDLDVLARAAEVMARSPRAILRGFGADSYGRALLAAGHRSTGLTQLDRAWDEYHRMDARVYRTDVQRAMREAGARRAKWSTVTTKPVSGWSSLTGAERRVATLIGAGHTNKSTAAELGVSINTVGTHLRTIFTKLGVRSRVQLANALHKEVAS